MLTHSTIAVVATLRIIILNTVQGAERFLFDPKVIYFLHGVCLSCSSELSVNNETSESESKSLCG